MTARQPGCPGLRGYAYRKGMHKGSPFGKLSTSFEKLHLGNPGTPFFNKMEVLQKPGWYLIQETGWVLILGNLVPHLENGSAHSGNWVPISGEKR